MNNETCNVAHINGKLGNTIAVAFNDEILWISIQHISDDDSIQSIVSEQLGLVDAIELRTIIDNYINNHCIINDNQGE